MGQVETSRVTPASSDGRAPSWLRALGAVAALAALAALVGILFPSLRLVDLEVYSQAGDAVLHGNPLYDARTPDLGLVFTYPPFAALLFVPLGSLATGSAALAWSVLSLASLARAMFLCLRSAGWLVPSGSRGPRVIVLVTGATVLALALEPAQVTLAWGQINLILMWLVLEDYLGDVPPKRRGILTGLATAVKLTPVVFIVFAVVIGRRRDALRSVLVVGAALLVGFAVPGVGAWDYWTRGLVSSERIGYQDSSGNQSVTGAIVRILDIGNAPTWSWLFSGLLVAAGLVVGRRLWAVGRDLEALSVVALGMLMASPISWTHHWVWFAPVLIALSARARIQRSAALLAVLVATVAISWVMRWGGGHHSGLDDLGAPLEYAQWLATDAYLLVGLVLLGWWAWSALRGTADRRDDARAAG